MSNILTRNPWIFAAAFCVAFLGLMTIFLLHVTNPEPVKPASPAPKPMQFRWSENSTLAAPKEPKAVREFVLQITNCPCLKIGNTLIPILQESQRDVLTNWYPLVRTNVSFYWDHATDEEK